MTAGSSIDYDALTQDALRGVVRSVLTQVAKTGLPGDHHFYIAFDTQAPGVVLSRRLKEKYPDEMMIVLQHRFWDLGVTEEGFEVKLTFDGIPERLAIPFQAVRVFFDPSVRFTLQFGEVGTQEEGTEAAGARRRRRDNAASEADAAQGPRPIGDRRPRRTRPRSERGEDVAADPPAAIEQPPFGIRPAEQPAAAKPTSLPSPTPSAPLPPAAAAAQAASVQPAADGGGAKILSLDKFRKK